jgi:hypothetical protein
MEALLGKLAQRIWRRRVLVALLWLVVLVLAAPLAGAQTKRLSGGGWDVPGSQSARARSLLAHVSGHEGERFAVFVEGANITAATADAQAILARHRDVLRTSPTEPLARGAALIPVGYVGPRGDVYDFLIDLRKELVRDADGTPPASSARQPCGRTSRPCRSRSSRRPSRSAFRSS